MDEHHSKLQCFLGQDCRPIAIDAKSNRLFALGLVDRRVGSRVDDHLRLYFTHSAADRIEFCKVRLGTAHSNELAEPWECGKQRRADLATLADKQDSQGNTSASFKEVPRRSLSASIGSSSSGHRMQSSGSFHCSVRSYCGA